MSGSRLGIQETAAYLRELDDVLLLTHVRPDGDTIGSAAALCQALWDMGKTAYLLYTRRSPTPMHLTPRPTGPRKAGRRSTSSA